MRREQMAVVKRKNGERMEVEERKSEGGDERTEGGGEPY